MFVALCITIGTLSAQPVFEEREPRELVICTHPEAANRFLDAAQHHIKARFHLYEQLAKLAVGEGPND